MTREIKFRAWNTKEKYMYYSENYDFLSDFVEHHIETVPQHHEIMQYIGLKDKNGKEIYECDIIDLCHEKFPEDSKYTRIVKYNFSSFLFFNPRNNVSSPIDKFSLENMGDHVIGNIYENPELLEVNQ